MTAAPRDLQTFPDTPRAAGERVELDAPADPHLAVADVHRTVPPCVAPARLCGWRRRDRPARAF